MTRDQRIEPFLAQLLSDAPTTRAPDRLRLDIASATRRERQRPAWLISLKETPMRYRSRVVVGSPTLRLAAAMVATAILTLAIAGAVIAGASPQPSPVTSETSLPTWITGNIEPVDDSCSIGAVTAAGEATRTAYECRSTWTSSDPRLTGEAWEPWVEDTYATVDGKKAVGSGMTYLETDDGGWACHNVFVAAGPTPTLSGPANDTTYTCTGSGGYEGLTAILVASPTEGFAASFTGLIFAGELPPAPEGPAAS